MCKLYSKVYVYYDSKFDFSFFRNSIRMWFEFALSLKNEIIGCIYSIKLSNLTLEIFVLYLDVLNI